MLKLYLTIRCITPRNPVSQQTNTLKKYHRSDCLEKPALSSHTCIYKLNSFSLHYLLLISCQHNYHLKYIQLRSAHSHRFVYVVR